MSYGIIHHRCEDRHQPVFHRADGTDHLGAKWRTYDEAYQAIIFHHQNGGVFPSEVHETHIRVCDKCGQPIPE